MEESNCGIYKIVNLVNGKIYVGSSCNLKKRMGDHFSALRRGNHGNKHLQRAYNKYGLDNFKFEILEIVSGVNIDLLLSREQYWLDKLGAEYNIIREVKMPPMFGKKHTEESKLIIREKRANQVIVLSDETKKKIAESNRGRKCTDEFRERCRKNMTGKKMSEETRRKMSESNKGRVMSESNREKLRIANTGRPSKLKGTKLPEHVKKKISEANKGHIVSKETRNKLSIAHKGKKLSKEHIDKIKHRMRTNHPSRGRKLSQSQKDKISENSKVPVRNVTTGKEFPSAKEAAEYYNMDSCHISCVCRGRACTSGGYVWEYISKDKIYAKAKNKTRRSVRNIDTDIIFESIKDASEKYKVGSSHIWRVCNGKRKTAGGFKWEYVDN